ncbi:hypothetical protein S58_23840 [Bradyrhizobium oligotrophicum S58]|uniref:Uncharacterized protein n=1 Tax=Bradyrhizobium oligotrophicum S58 TaxID=1245469 RepID=M4ZQ95_9BRAD|nr:hypothetical protein S58_23840 [Bradyrhizobium oligotrophicum S58]
MAADTRAACVAFVERITPTSVLIAVFVWLRAIERISVIVFDIVASGLMECEFRWHRQDGASAAAITTRPNRASEIR